MKDRNRGRLYILKCPKVLEYSRHYPLPLEVHALYCYKPIISYTDVYILKDPQGKRYNPVLVWVIFCQFKTYSKMHIFVFCGWSKLFWIHNPALSLFSFYQCLALCKVSRKSLEPLLRKTTKKEIRNNNNNNGDDLIGKHQKLTLGPRKHLVATCQCHQVVMSTNQLLSWSSITGPKARPNSS